MSGTDIASVIDEFLIILGGSDKARTVAWHRQKLGRFVRFLQENHLPISVEDIKSVHIARFYAYLRDGGLRESTIRGYQITVRAFFGWYYEFR